MAHDIRRWIARVALAETLGFGVAASVAALVTVSGIAPAPGYLLTVAGGAVEGAMLGVGQWLGMPGGAAPCGVVGRDRGGCRSGLVDRDAALHDRLRSVLGCGCCGLRRGCAGAAGQHERSPLALVVGLYVAAGLLMAVTVAAATAVTAVRLFPRVGSVPRVGSGAAQPAG